MKEAPFLTFYSDEGSDKLEEFSGDDTLKDAVANGDGFADETTVYIYKLVKKGVCRSRVEWE